MTLAFNLAYLDRESFMAGVDQYDLMASKNIYIPPLCTALIPHGIKVETQSRQTVVMIVRTPGTFGKALLVDSGPVDEDEEVYTSVFNLSKDRIRIQKGQVISRLVSLQRG